MYDLSGESFINVSPAGVDAAKTPGLPFERGGAPITWAGGREYRRSSPRLACVPLDRVEDLTAIRYRSPEGWSTV